MTTASATETANSTSKHPYRRRGIWALFPLPAWLLCFTILFGGALGARVLNGVSVSEQAAYYQSLPPVGIWIFTLGAIVAITLLGIAIVSLTRITRATQTSGARALSAIALVIAAITTVLEWINSVVVISLLTIDPAAVPPAIDVLASTTTNQLINAISWTGFTVATSIIAFLLYRARVLPRAGLVVAILGAVFLVLSFIGSFFVPMVSAVLLFVLGVALVRRRA